MRETRRTWLGRGRWRSRWRDRRWGSRWRRCGRRAGRWCGGLTGGGDQHHRTQDRGETGSHESPPQTGAAYARRAGGIVQPDCNRVNLLPCWFTSRGRDPRARPVDTGSDCIQHTDGSVMSRRRRSAFRSPSSVLREHLADEPGRHGSVSVGFGLLGSGFMAHTYAECLAKHVPDGHLVAVALGSRAPGLADEYGVALEPTAESAPRPRRHRRRSSSRRRIRRTCR